jgi:transposase-like protein
MSSVYELYKKSKEADIVLSFRGEVTEDFMASVFLIMESKMEGDAQQQRLRKKVNNILVECLQNLYHHMDESDGVDRPEDKRSAIFLVCRDHINRYSIVTGNHILNSNIDMLKKKIDQVNTMTVEELKAYYREALGNSEFSAKGGAGLGMIEMARKSGNRLEYHFDPVNDTMSFFSLIIKID